MKVIKYQVLPILLALIYKYQYKSAPEFQSLH